MELKYTDSNSACPLLRVQRLVSHIKERTQPLRVVKNRMEGKILGLRAGVVNRILRKILGLRVRVVNRILRKILGLRVSVVVRF
jgi:hypothetical protein